jgi:hypothetical protein
MQRRVFLLLGLLLAMPVMAQAAVISMQGTGDLLPETAGQQITLLLSGGDTYTDSNLRLTINGGVGPAPAVQLIFNDPASTIPGANLAGSIWAGGAAGIAIGGVNGTTADSSGLVPIAAFQTAAGGTPQNTDGIYAVLTVSTVGVAPGTYSFSLEGTDLINGLNEDFEPIFVGLQFAPMQLSIVPEPSSIVMGLFAAAGLAAVVIRRRRAA